MNWLLFLPQLPAKPSSLRVNVWRQLRSVGAVSPQNGVWFLPNRTEYSAFLSELLSDIQAQGASGQIFAVSPLTPEIDASLLEQNRNDCKKEYAGLCDRGGQFLARYRQLTARNEFTFANLAQGEDDLNRLVRNLTKIRIRDYAECESAEEARLLLETCQVDFKRYCEGVSMALRTRNRPGRVMESEDRGRNRFSSPPNPSGRFAQEPPGQEGERDVSSNHP